MCVMKFNFTWSGSWNHGSTGGIVLPLAPTSNSDVPRYRWEYVFRIRHLFRWGSCEWYWSLIAEFSSLCRSKPALRRYLWDSSASIPALIVTYQCTSSSLVAGPLSWYWNIGSTKHSTRNQNISSTATPQHLFAGCLHRSSQPDPNLCW